jgi:hypothetical protein
MIFPPQSRSEQMADHSNSGNITAVYSRAHDAILTVAGRYGLVPFDVRLLVALLERGGEGRTDDLEWELRAEGAMVRRSYGGLRAVGYVEADAGPGTTEPRRGTRTRLMLTATGRRVALDAVEWAA